MVTMWSLLVYIAFLGTVFSAPDIDIDIRSLFDCLEGKPFALSCTVVNTVSSASPDVEFLKRTERDDINMATISDGRFNITVTKKGNTAVGVLSFSNVSLTDETRDGYLCKGSVGSKMSKVSFMLYVIPKSYIPAISFQNVTEAKKKEPWLIICKAKTIAQIPIQTTWQFSISKGKSLTELKNTSNIIITDKPSSPVSGAEVNKQLYVKSVNIKNGGYYYCKSTIVTPTRHVFSVSRMTSMIISMSRDDGVAQGMKVKVFKGDATTLTCKVSGFPKGEVLWSKGDKLITGKESRFSLSSYNGVQNAVLKISKTAFSDRGVYLCNGTNDATYATIEFTLRVKDPLGPLWPFIGIVIEAIVLAIIIFISEKYNAAKHKTPTKGVPERTNRTETAPLLPKSGESGVGYTAGGKRGDDGLAFGEAEPIA